MLTPVNAKIQQTQFVVLESSVKIVLQDETTEVDITKVPIEMDFDISHNHEVEPDIVRIILEIHTNQQGEFPGYELFLRVGGEYRLAEDLDPFGDESKALISNSAVTCLINEARVYLQTITSFSLFGPYIMPMLDMGDIWKQKYEFDAESTKPETKTKSRKKKSTTK